MKKIIFVITFLLSLTSIASDPFAYSRIYGKLSSVIYELEETIQDITEKNIFIEVEQFTSEDAKDNCFRILVEGSNSFDFRAQFVLNNLTNENLETQLQELQAFILQEIEIQIALRQKDTEVLRAIHDKLGSEESVQDLTTGLTATAKFTTIWMQLPSIENGETKWLRSSIRLTGSDYEDFRAGAGVKTTIWSWHKEVESDLEPASNRSVILKLGSIDANFKFTGGMETKLDIELAAFEYSESIKINDTLKFFYQGAIALGLEFLFSQNQHNSYLPFGTKITIGLIINNQFLVHLGIDAELGILQDWHFVKKDSALTTELGVDFITNEHMSLSLSGSYTFTGSQYPNTSKSGWNFRVGIRLKL